MAMLAARPQKQGSNRLTGSQRLLLALGAAWLSAACTDGYPTDDEQIVSPVELTQTQRLHTMNLLGQDAHPETTWTYSAVPGCQLRVVENNPDMGKQTFRLPMENVEVNVGFDNTERVYSVSVQPWGADDVDRRLVLRSNSWVDAIEMGNLVRSFQIGCRAERTSEADSPLFNPASTP